MRIKALSTILAMTFVLHVLMFYSFNLVMKVIKPEPVKVSFIGPGF